MSEKNVETALRWLAVISSRDPGRFGELKEICEEDADYYPVRKWPESRPRHGLEDVAGFAHQFWAAYAVSEFRLIGAKDAGNDRVLLELSLHAEGTTSGVILEGRLYESLWLRHGRLFRIEDHLTLPGALYALGFDAETLEDAGLG